VKNWRKNGNWILNLDFGLLIRCKIGGLLADFGFGFKDFGFGFKDLGLGLIIRCKIGGLLAERWNIGGLLADL
jgi:hypothetical protein